MGMLGATFFFILMKKKVATQHAIQNHKVTKLKMYDVAKYSIHDFLTEVVL
jgi:hypothetical protein